MESANQNPIFRHLDQPDVLLDEAERKGLKKLVLEESAKKGYTRLMKKCIERKYNLNPYNSKGPLFYALLKKRVKIVNLLTKNGANVAHTFKGRSILSYAVESERHDVVKFLLDNDASANGVHQLTPLHHAAKKGDQMIVSLLLLKRASVDPLGKEFPLYPKVTPLSLAIQNHHVEASSILLRAGATLKGKGCSVPNNAGVELKELVKSHKEARRNS